MQQLIAGVVGCGNISRFHFSGLEKAGATIRWVCDLNEAAARPWQERFGARYTADFNDILADPEVHLVDVTTISAAHRAVCLGAIAAGKAVICEKTLAVHAAEAREIVSLARQRGTPFFTAYMKRYLPAVVQAKALLPGLGRIMSSYWRTYQQWGPVWTENPPGGFYTPPGGTSSIVQRYGGGILPMGGSHILDLVMFFLGRPTRVYATQTQPPGRDYEVQACALLETPNGTAHFEALAHPLTRIGFLRDGLDERFEINGVNGRLDIYSSCWDDVTTRAGLLVHYDNQTGTATEYRYPPTSAFDREVAAFCADVRSGRQTSQSPLTGWEVDHLIDYLRRSAQTGQALTVDWTL
jgi:predicted dehydrogenase